MSAQTIEASNSLPPTPCSAEVSAELYHRLEYYRNFMPFCVGMSESDYAATQEAINADAALAAYRDQTGEVANQKPSEPNVKISGTMDKLNAMLDAGLEVFFSGETSFKSSTRCTQSRSYAAM